jgi:hypothetical protein
LAIMSSGEMELGFSSSKRDAHLCRDNDNANIRLDHSCTSHRYPGD